MSLFQQRHYKFLEEIIKNNVENGEIDTENFIEELMYELKNDNPRFNEDLFLERVGLE